jgi:hypothetical protein
MLRCSSRAVVRPGAGARAAHVPKYPLGPDFIGLHDREAAPAGRCGIAEDHAGNGEYAGNLLNPKP